ncbi:MAG: hypothetical protein EHM45_06675 [Desulfobacteraceae bacterium]|nr:MAG: hypothetical protein EHM45_06675 [Desulfobacteraceae bacterium]
MKKPNEQSACEAFLVILNALTGLKYIKIESPDEQNRRTPDVDFLLKSINDESDMIAVEHTILESYNGQIGYVKGSYDIVDSINAVCKNTIPNDRYYFLAIPPVKGDSLVGKNRIRFVSSLSSWVTETAQKLSIDNHAQIEYEGQKITLMCCGDDVQLNGNVWRASQSPEKQEILQTQRLCRAIGDKLPKLEAYKQRSFKTALLLEDIANIPSTITQRAHGMNSEERDSIEDIIDYIVVFASNNGRMIVGDVWKEPTIWHVSIPDNRKFNFRKNNKGKAFLGI